jgi:glycosyltransferase involved in cell wall biosynthesis
MGSEPLRVCLVGLIAGGYSGVPRYAAALTRGIDEVAHEFPELQLELVTTREGATAANARNIRVRDIRFRGRRVNAGLGRILLEQAYAAAARTDLLHFFDTSGPVLAPWRPFVTTVHDVSVPQGLRPRKHEYKRLLWPWAVRHASTVVAISVFAGAEAVEILGADAGRLQVIVSGPGLVPADGGYVPEAVPGHPFFLYVGQLAANKNLPFLIEAFDRAELSPDVRLLLVGRPGDGYAETLATIARCGTRDRVEIRCDVNDDELETLYRSAIALVHPAVYEGFGFTPLEAMARGCAVVASDIPALRETAGEGALLVAVDRDAWAAALAKVAGDEAFRGSLRSRGRSRVALFSWQGAARALCQVFSAHRRS